MNTLYMFIVTAYILNYSSNTNYSSTIYIYIMDNSEINLINVSLNVCHFIIPLLFYQIKPTNTHAR